MQVMTTNQPELPEGSATAASPADHAAPTDGWRWVPDERPDRRSAATHLALAAHQRPLAGLGPVHLPRLVPGVQLDAAPRRRPAADDSDVTLPGDEAGQATAEYALVLLGAAAIALLVVSWATKTNVVGKLLDVIFSQLIGRATGGR